MTDNPFKVLADHFGCTPAEIANMTRDDIAAAGDEAKRRNELLRHYAAPNKTVQTYQQYDGFMVGGHGDDIMRPDDDGDCLFNGTVNELRTGGWAVRVHVHESVQRAEAARILRKILAWVESEPTPEGSPF